MKRIKTQLLLAVLCFTGTFTFAQVEKFAATITPADLKTHLFKIASVEMQGRETATEGQRIAAGYIEEQFKKLGLKPILSDGYQQTFPVYRDSLVKTSFIVNGTVLKHDSDFAVLSNAGLNKTSQTEEFVFAGFGLSDSIRNDYSGVDANGKVVVVWPGVPPPSAKEKKPKSTAADYRTLQQAAKKNGADALIIVQERFLKGPSQRVGRMYANDFRKDSLPNTFVISDSTAQLLFGAAIDTVRKAVKESTPVATTYRAALTLELEKKTEQLNSSNVIGMLEGTDKKDEAIIITAHYDHLGKRDSTVYFGADDDGSGTVSVLEMAEAFSKAADAGKRPRRNVIFMTVSGEEKGLWGSEYYSEHPAFPLDKTSADINIDMIGRIEKGRKGDSLNYIYVVGDNRISSDLRPISESMNKQHLKIKFDYKYNDPNDPERIFYRSDHYNFAKNGVPAIFYFSGLHDDYHRPTDTPDKIRYDLLSKRGQMIFYNAWEIANRDQMLKRDLP